MLFQYAISLFVCLTVFSGNGTSGSNKTGFKLKHSIDSRDFSFSSFTLDLIYNTLPDTTDQSKSSNSIPAVKPEVGFIKKLFSSATKEEKTAQKEAKNLKEIQNKQIQVYGWYPYWMNSAKDDINYNLITTFSFYSVDIYRDSITKQISFIDHSIGIPLTHDILSKASNAGCSLDLTFMCKDKTALNLLFHNKIAQDSCINYISNKLNSNYLFDGVCIVFENIPPNNSGSFLVFMTALQKKLMQNSRALKLALPAKDFSCNFDILKLNAIVDSYILMGYNYYLEGNIPGPVAPLDDFKRNLSLKNSVRDYLKNGVPYSKLIVALPYYGIVWKKKSVDSEEYAFYKHLTYSQILKNIAQFNPLIQFDSVLCTNYFSYKVNGDLFKCYYDSDESLSKKYKWLVKQGMAGIGIWALGYDNGSQDFWEMINKNFKVEKFYPLQKEIVIKKNQMTDTVSKSIVKGDSTVNHTTLITNSLTSDTLFSQIVHPVIDTSTNKSKDEKSWLAKKLKNLEIRIDPILSNKIVVASLIITLIIFGLLGIITSLLFSSVRELLYIMNLPVYFLANAILILAGLALFSFLNLLKPDINEMSPFLYAFIHKCIWVVLVLCWVLINFLSHRLVGTFSLKRERP